MAVISAYAGMPPWRVQKKRLDAKSGYEWRAGVGTKYSKKTGYREYATGGWNVIQPDQYTQNPTKPEMTEVHLYNGRRSYVPIGDVEYFIGQRKMDPREVTQELSDYIHKAFDKEEGRGRWYPVSGAGHIEGMRYNPSYQVLETSFGGKSPTTVTFLRVPRELYLEFDRCGTSMSLGQDGTQRHLLGIRFWDLVRIRGQRTGSRYQFTYTTEPATPGSEAQGSYVETQERQNVPQAQQPVDAIRESTVVIKEQPAEQEKVDIEKDATLKALAAQIKSGKYNVGQEKSIRRMRDKLEDRYGGILSPAYREFSTAVVQGWGAVLDVAKKYKLTGD
jgi:hypothetical protein